jgi:hypothetical protein
MNTRISIHSIEDFDRIVSNLNNCLNNIKQSFDIESKSMNEIFDDPKSWSGKSRDKANEKYEIITKVHPNVIESLQNFVTFLEDTSNRYKELEKSTNDAIDKYSEELNVN